MVLMVQILKCEAREGTTGFHLGISSISMASCLLRHAYSTKETTMNGSEYKTYTPSTNGILFWNESR